MVGSLQQLFQKETTNAHDPAYTEQDHVKEPGNVRRLAVTTTSIHAPLSPTEAKQTSLDMEECSSKRKENVEYEMKLRTTGFDIDPYELPKNI